MRVGDAKLSCGLKIEGGWGGGGVGAGGWGVGGRCLFVWDQARACLYD